MTVRRRLIAVDFDGVLHSYTSPWTDAATISDGPTPGAMAFLRALVDDDRFDVVIVSSRLAKPEGRSAIEKWLWPELVTEFGGTQANRIQLAISFSVERPPAFLAIDDRAWTFDGDWPDLDTIAAFKPWNKRPPAEVQPTQNRRFQIRSNRLSDPDAVVEASTPGAALDAFLRAGPRGESVWPRFPDMRRVRIDGPEGTIVFSTDAKDRWCAVHPDDLHRGWLAPKGEAA